MTTSCCTGQASKLDCDTCPLPLGRTAPQRYSDRCSAHLDLPDLENALIAAMRPQPSLVFPRVDSCTRPIAALVRWWPGRKTESASCRTETTPCRWARAGA